jgi:hypothetical protein
MANLLHSHYFLAFCRMEMKQVFESAFRFALSFVPNFSFLCFPAAEMAICVL